MISEYREKDVCYLTITDNNYVAHLLAMIASLARVENSVPIFIAQLDLTIENQELIQEYADSLRLRLTILPIPDIDLSGFEPCRPYPPVGWLKFYVDRFLPPQYQRIFFIDPDTIILKSIKHIFATDMGGKPLAAVVDPQDTNAELRSRLGIEPREHYFNCGVLLIDRKKFVDMHIGEKAADFAMANPEKISFIEQCAFNAVSCDQFHRLGNEWNMMMVHLNEDPHHTNIVHYCGMKPWKTGRAPGIELYTHFRNKTPLPFHQPLSMKLEHLYYRIRDRLRLSLLAYRLIGKSEKYQNELVRRGRRVKFADYVTHQFK